MDWRAAESIKVLLSEVNAIFPDRDKRTDGAVSGYPGSKSSHQINSKGVVCAQDITVGDYPGGITPAQATDLAEQIRLELKVAPRGLYAYVIYNKRIAHGGNDWEWAPYAGVSEHTDHIHVSVDWDILEGEAPSGACPYDDTATWHLTRKEKSLPVFTLPTSRIVTQDWAQEFYDFNGQSYPNGFYHSIGWNGHNGIDYGCFVGDTVEAVCEGVIEYVGPGNNHPLMTGGGNVIILRNDELQMRFGYLHLSQQNVYTGQWVTPGQVIGLSGQSGVVTAPHLHLEAFPVGYVNQFDGWRGRVDPTPYLYGPMNPDYAGISTEGGTTAPKYTENEQFFIDLQMNLP